MKVQVVSASFRYGSIAILASGLAAACGSQKSISQSQLTQIAPLPQCNRFMVQSKPEFDGMNLRQSPNGSVITVAKNGTFLTRLRTEGAWFFVELDSGEQGYLFAEGTRLVDCDIQPTPDPRPVPPDPRPVPPVEDYKMITCFDSAGEFGGRQIFTANISNDINGKFNVLSNKDGLTTPRLNAKVTAATALQGANARSFRLQTEGAVARSSAAHSPVDALRAMEFQISSPNTDTNTLRLVFDSTSRSFNRCRVTSHTRLVYSLAGSWTVAKCKDTAGKEILSLDMVTNDVGVPLALKGRTGWTMADNVNLSVGEFQAFNKNTFTFTTATQTGSELEAQFVAINAPIAPQTNSSVQFTNGTATSSFDVCTVSNLGLLSSIGQ